MAGSEIQQTIYNMEKEKMRKRSLIIGILSFIILLLAGVGFWAYCLILAPDFEPRKTVYVYIDEKKDFDDLCRQLVDSAGCQRIGSFKQACRNAEISHQYAYRTLCCGAGYE